MEQIQKITQKVVFEREGKYLLLKDAKGNWELPGGSIDFAENSDDALRRELSEELGLVDGDYTVGELMGKFNIICKKSEASYHFLALVYRGELNRDDIKLSDEHSELGWFSKEELLKLKMVDGYKEFFDKYLKNIY